MSLQAQVSPVSASVPAANSVAPAATEGLDPLQQSAALEFHATLQLLAERARYLTGASGVAIALEEQQKIVYTAASGTLASEIGSIAGVTKYPPRSWVAEGTIRYALAEHAQGSTADIAVAIQKDEKLVGFFEIAPGPLKFEKTDLATVARLAALVGTALDERAAAVQIPVPVAAPPVVKPNPAMSPVRWHAPECPAPGVTPDRNVPGAPTVPADVHPCTACGFPISGVRTICVDCDTRRDQSPLAPVSLAELFKVEKQESWIDAHGYTVATVLVSALTAAIIYWLR